MPSIYVNGEPLIPRRSAPKNDATGSGILIVSRNRIAGPENV